MAPLAAVRSQREWRLRCGILVNPDELAECYRKLDVTVAVEWIDPESVVQGSDKYRKAK
jgi:hypothetical protein